MGYRRRQSGFTVVELLIVVAVIAILSIVIAVAYNGVSRDARLAGAQSDLKSELDRAKLWALDNGNPNWPSSLANAQTAGLFEDTENMTFDSTNYIVNNSTSPKQFCVSATASDGVTKYAISSTADHALNGICITNLVVNPSAEATNSYTAGGPSSVTYDTSWYSSGSRSVRIAPTDSVSSDSFSTIGGDLGGFRTGLAANKTYAVSATVRLSGALTGTLSSRARQVTAWYTSSGGAHNMSPGLQAANAAGVTRTYLTYTIPSGSIAGWIRLYNGATLNNGIVWYDDMMITEGSTIYRYGDGNSEGWFWNGTPHNSTSTGPGVPQ